MTSNRKGWTDRELWNLVSDSTSGDLGDMAALLLDEKTRLEESHEKEIDALHTVLAEMSDNMTTVWLVNYQYCDEGNVEGVWDNQAAAENQAAALIEAYGNEYSVDKLEVRSVSTHRVERWFVASAGWDNFRGYSQDIDHERHSVEEATFEMPADTEVLRFRSTYDNPRHVKGTPNSRIPDTPGGRLISTPAWSVVVNDRDEGVARLRARTLLDAALAEDGIVRDHAHDRI